MKVFVYRNLNRKGVVFSVKDKKSGLVVDRQTDIVLEDCTFKVSQAGRTRVLENRRRNVHAGIEGIRSTKIMSRDGLVKVTYNPYFLDSFVIEQTKQPVSHAEYVIFCEEGVYAKVT